MWSHRYDHDCVFLLLFSGVWQTQTKTHLSPRACRWGHHRLRMSVYQYSFSMTKMSVGQFSSSKPIKLLLKRKSVHGLLGWSHDYHLTIPQWWGGKQTYYNHPPSSTCCNVPLFSSLSLRLLFQSASLQIPMASHLMLALPTTVMAVPRKKSITARNW